VTRGGNRDQEFEEAFDELLGRALAAARRVLGRTPAAEDAAAEAMARAYAHWPKIAELPHRGPWVMRVATNVAFDVLRRQPGPAVSGPSASPDGADASVDRLALLAAVRRLPRRQREVVALSYLSDVPEADVAKVLGISCGSVKTHLHRGLAALRRTLGPDSEEAGLAVFD
jgi:RNA polymerase sigma-70 factor (ECF subfamily)